MGWEDRRYQSSDDGGRFRAALRRIFGDGENPLDWAIPLWTAWGIRVRLHIIFAFTIFAELFESITHSGMGFWYKFSGIGSLFVLVLLHEYGHCIACRRIGGTANQILMWPLGGLASCDPPRHDWKSSLIVTLGGPAVNAILWPILGVVLALLGVGWSGLFFNPFRPLAYAPTMAKPDYLLPTVTFLWWLYYCNAMLLLFNMLLPMYPMDGARTIQAILWRTMGYTRATRLVVTVGLVVAIALAVFAITANELRLVLLAIFGGGMCYVEKRRLAMADDHPALAGYDFSRGYGGMPDDEDEERQAKAREKRLKKEQEDQAELDRILAKIASTGMGSLTKGEKRWLERTSERRRQG